MTRAIHSIKSCHRIDHFLLLDHLGAQERLGRGDRGIVTLPADLKGTGEATAQATGEGHAPTASRIASRQ